MRVVIQRVTHASVSIEGKVKSKIGEGYMILVGICSEDTEEDIQWLVKKIIGLRIFDDEHGVMNLSIQDVGGDILVVSQFTLMASYKKGNRPSWIKAAPHAISIPLYNRFCEALSEERVKSEECVLTPKIKAAESNKWSSERKRSDSQRGSKPIIITLSIC